jgi:uncharacterized protein with HEPN domain
MRSEDLYLADIVLAADAVSDYIKGVSWERFSAERMIRSAVIHELQIIGEAVSKISKALKHRYPSVPWAEIVGFRNVVVHEYFGVDAEIVWRTATLNAPKIRSLIVNVLKDEYPLTYVRFFEINEI